MPVERLTASDDPRVAEYRDVPEPELVRARGLFIAEGRLVVRRLIQDGRFLLRSVLVSERAYESLRVELDAIAARVSIYVCQAGDFPEITGFNLHRGCVALVERPPQRAVEPLVAAARRVVVLEGVANADNVGGVFRNAAAFGADAVLLSPTTCDPLYRKAIRTSMAATLRLPFARLEPWPDRLRQLKTDGFTIVALTPREPAIDLEVLADTPYPPKLALLVGAEGDGLTPAVEAIADVRVRIPIAPEIDSLNLAVAVGIALYRLSRSVSGPGERSG